MPPAAQTAHRTEARLRVCVVLRDAVAPSDGELRLLDALSQDPRYELAELFHAPPVEPEIGAPGGAVLALERRVLPGRQAYNSAAWADLRAKARPLTPGSAVSATCDVAVDFCHAPQADPLADTARFGVWRLSSYGTASVLADAIAGRPVTQVHLLRFDGTSQPPRLMAQAVYDTKALAALNLAYCREKSVQLVLQALARVHRDQAPPDLGPAPDTGPVTRLAPALPGYALRTLGESIGRVRRTVSVRLGGSPRPFALRIGTGDITSFDPAAMIDVVQPARRFWADPFLIAAQERVWCFFEDYDYKRRLGEIGVGVLTDTGIDYMGTALTAPHHLSFPNVFHHGDDIFMMPETNQARRLEIWRATAFPTKWQLHATALKDQRPADSTLFQWQGDWWVLTGLCQDGFGDHCGELHLFRTSGPDLKWMEPHPLNPVVIGADRARMGGRVHVIADRLYRVSQDNSGGIYGYGLNIMQIDRLSPDDYQEHCLRHIPPDFAPGLIGCHHFDAAGGRVVLDVRRP